MNRGTPPPPPPNTGSQGSGSGSFSSGSSRSSDCSQHDTYLWDHRGRLTEIQSSKYGSTTNDVRGVARKVFLGMAPVSNDLSEMSPQRMDVRRGQVTPLAYHRPRYPLPSCTSAELDSVFLGSSSLIFAIGSHNE